MRMKLSKHKNKKPLILIAAAGVLVVAAGVYALLHAAQNKQNIQQTPTQSSPPRKVGEVDYSPPTDQDKKAQDEQKNQIIQQATQPSNSPSTIAVSISRASQPSAGQPLDVRTIVSGTTDGTCNVTLSKDGQPTVEKSFAITIQATYATCANTQIAANDFSASGTWKLQIIVKNGSVSSAPASQDVTITK